jgi:glyoxylase-like metal-dependent hydrolase (beta-lactamase superfamily II)
MSEAQNAVVEVAPGVRRITANNPGPMTFTGTNTYIVGDREAALIDPGPDDADHIARLVAALAGKLLTHILVTHRHRDHVGGAARLKAATGAATLAATPTSGRNLPIAGNLEVEAPPDEGFVPDKLLADGDVIEGKDWRIEIIATPGHASDHLVFAMPDNRLIFTGDHVMGWSTSLVAPPDGNMSAYMASLAALAIRPERLYLPGHGDPIPDGPRRVDELALHRGLREAAILERLASGDCRIGQIVAAVYADTDPALHAAAALSVLAHLEDLAARGRVVAAPRVALDATFQPTSLPLRSPAPR